MLAGERRGLHRGDESRGSSSSAPALMPITISRRRCDAVSLEVSSSVACALVALFLDIVSDGDGHCRRSADSPHFEA